MYACTPIRSRWTEAAPETGQQVASTLGVFRTQQGRKTKNTGATTIHTNNRLSREKRTTRDQINAHQSGITTIRRKENTQHYHKNVPSKILHHTSVLPSGKRCTTQHTPQTSQKRGFNPEHGLRDCREVFPPIIGAKSRVGGVRVTS